MRLVKVNEEDVRYFKKTKNLELLEEFINSGESVCEVVDYTHQDAKSAYWSLRNSVIRFGFNKISVATRKGRVYLIREDI